MWLNTMPAQHNELPLQNFNLTWILNRLTAKLTRINNHAADMAMSKIIPNSLLSAIFTSTCLNSMMDEKLLLFLYSISKSLNLHFETPTGIHLLPSCLVLQNRNLKNQCHQGSSSPQQRVHQAFSLEDPCTCTL